MIITRTPYRVSFAGGGTDIEDFYKHGYGAVVSTTIDKYVYLAIHEYFENQFVLKYSQTEMCDVISDIKHPLIRECLRLVQPTNYLEISSFADIPSKGSGLGSSSAFSVGLIHALLQQRGLIPTAEACAHLACAVEIDKLHEPIGKQDQYASAFGGLNYIRFNSDGTTEVRPIGLTANERRELGNNLVLFYTGVTRQASSILHEQKKLSSTNEYMVRMNSIRDGADKLFLELKEGNIHAIGEAMHNNWIWKRQAAGVTNSNFEHIYSRALEAGAIGGKLLGAGGGGFFLFYTERPWDLINALPELRHVKFNMEEIGTQVIYT